MKKILLVEPVSDLGGVTQYIKQIVVPMEKDNFEFHFVAAPGGDSFKLFKEYGVLVHPLLIDYSWRTFFRAYRVLRAFLANEYFDSIHAHTVKAGFLCAVACRGVSSKFIYTGHGWRYMQVHNPIRKIVTFLIEKYIVHCADFVTFLSTSELQNGITAHILTQEKASVIPFSIDLPEIKNLEVKNIREFLSLPANAFVVVMVGRITEQKDPETFIRALSVLKEKIPFVYFVWIGDGELKDCMLQKATAMDVVSRLKITGALSQNSVRELLPSCDVMLFTSLFEGLPISILEAMAYGVPIVAANVGSIADIIIDSKTGRLFAQRDAVNAATIILELYTKPEMKEVYIKNARALIEKSYAPAGKTADLFSDLYTKL